ncbi:hypothetical protein [Sanguibacter sp. HDW7]|uniref:hypothetical protein n=1 Tax=Sanguibacter sp. HDW7 TaxID=2714931 RepID=UPI00140849E2|nr:hypothetical protein [Sanguibacter sp. HDW7]QIK82983.1 hypothetical protein G7063_04590 [Sanguibacter sp. HDW7]
MPSVAPGVSPEVSRASNELVTLDGSRYVQRAPGSSRTWTLQARLLSPADLAFLAACADGTVPGPLFLYTDDAARTNLLPSDVAAPGRAGTTALGSSLGVVLVGMPSGVETVTGAVQASAAGAWSATVPLQAGLSYTLSAWASTAGTALAWRTLSRAGAQLQTGVVTTAAAAGAFCGQSAFTPDALATGVQVALAAGTATVGGLRLTEGEHEPVWLSGRGVPVVVVDDPAETLQLITDREVFADYTVTIREVAR